MKLVKKIAFEKPVIFSVIVMLLAVGCTFIPFNLCMGGRLNEQAADYFSGMIVQTIVSVVLILLLWKMQLLKPAGFTCKIEQLWIVWPMVLVIVLDGLDVVVGTIQIDTTQKITIVMYILVYLSTGLFEETLCRGLAQTLFIRKWGRTRKGIYFSVILNSLLFGMFHLIHFFLGHATLLASIAQVTYATFIGVFMSACVLRNKNIVPVMILHGFIDIAGSLREIAVNGGINKEFMTMTVSGAVKSIALMLPVLLYGLFILRKCTCEEIIDSAND